MISNIHIHEKLLFERHRELLREMEQRRLLKGVRRQRFNVLPRIAGRAGMFLIALGTSLKRFEPSREPTV